MKWKLIHAKHALKDAKKLVAAGLKLKAGELLDIVAHDPFQNPLAFEKHVGDLAGAYSRRINIQHRLVYEVFEKARTVRVLRMWTHREPQPNPAMARTGGPTPVVCMPALYATVVKNRL